MLKKPFKKNLSGWYRLWIFISIISLITTISYTVYIMPKKMIDVPNAYYHLTSKIQKIAVQRALDEGYSQEDISRYVNNKTLGENRDQEIDAIFLASDNEKIRPNIIINTQMLWILRGILIWLSFAVCLYILGWCFGWIYRGFKN